MREPSACGSCASASAYGGHQRRLPRPSPRLPPEVTLRAHTPLSLATAAALSPKRGLVTASSAICVTLERESSSAPAVVLLRASLLSFSLSLSLSLSPWERENPIKPAHFAYFMQVYQRTNASVYLSMTARARGSARFTAATDSERASAISAADQPRTSARSSATPCCAGRCWSAATNASRMRCRRIVRSGGSESTGMARASAMGSSR